MLNEWNKYYFSRDKASRDYWPRLRKVTWRKLMATVTDIFCWLVNQHQYQLEVNKTSYIYSNNSINIKKYRDDLKLYQYTNCEAFQYATWVRVRGLIVLLPAHSRLSRITKIGNKQKNDPPVLPSLRNSHLKKVGHNIWPTPHSQG